MLVFFPEFNVKCLLNNPVWGNCYTYILWKYFCVRLICFWTKSTWEIPYDWSRVAYSLHAYDAIEFIILSVESQISDGTWDGVCLLICTFKSLYGQHVTVLCTVLLHQLHCMLRKWNDTSKKHTYMFLHQILCCRGLPPPLFFGTARSTFSMNKLTFSLGEYIVLKWMKYSFKMYIRFYLCICQFLLQQY